MYVLATQYLPHTEFFIIYFHFFLVELHWIPNVTWDSVVQYSDSFTLCCFPRSIYHLSPPGAVTRPSTPFSRLRLSVIAGLKWDFCQDFPISSPDNIHLPQSLPSSLFSGCRWHQWWRGSTPQALTAVNHFPSSSLTLNRTTSMKGTQFCKDFWESQLYPQGVGKKM